MKKLFTFFLSLILFAGIAQAQPGALDATFDPAAELFTPPVAVNSQNTYNWAVSAQQADDKTILYYDLPTYNGVSLSTNIIRITKNGALDNSFNTGTGAAGTSQFGPDKINAMMLQADGKILIGGGFTSINGSPCGGIARLNADGSLDNSFITGTGLIINDQIWQGNGYVNSFAIQPDGKIIAVGYFSSYNGTVCKSIVRLNTDGSVDNSFNSTSLTFFTGVVNVDGSINTCALQSSGKIVVGGIDAVFNAVYSTTQRLNSDGTVDNSFPTLSEAYRVLVQPDDKIIVTCPLTVLNNVKRYNADGSADATFHIGSASTYINVSSKLQSDGKILVSSIAQYSDGQTTIPGFIARLQSNGLIDNSFTSAITACGGYPDPCHISFIELTQNNKIITGHINSSSEFNINRLNSDGSFDNATPGTEWNRPIENLSLQADGKIIIGGFFAHYNGIARQAIARINPDGSLDESFTAGLAPNSVVNTTALQADGKILAGGFHFSGSTVNKTFARFNADGTEDVDFTNNLANGGTSLSGIGTLSNVNKILIQPDGKIIVVANETIGGIVARLNADGTTDVSFSIGVSNGAYYNAILQPDGKIIIRGNFNTYSSPPTGTPITGLSNLIRLNSDGSLDLNFTPPDVAPLSYLTSIALQTDGKILFAGGINNAPLVGIFRTNADGTLDTDFVPSPISQNGFLFFEVQTINVQNDGKIIVGGFFNIFTTDPYQQRNDLVRLKSDGSLDSSFNQGATGFTNPALVNYNPSGGVHASIIQPDGKLIIAGGFNTNLQTLQLPVVTYNDMPVYSIARIITAPCPGTVTPSVSIVASEVGSICAATPVTFTATPVNGGATPHYQWKKNAVNVGTNSATYTYAGFADGDSITCVLHGYVPCLLPETAISNSITISVTPSVTPSLSIALTTGTLPVCVGSPLTFTATPVNGGDTPAYQWRITRAGNTFNAGINAPAFTYDSYNNNDVVSCVLTSNATCASTANANSNGITVAVQNPSFWYLDADGDFYYTGNPVVSCTSPGTGYINLSITGGDCNDNNAFVHPNATEILGNNIDDNCNGEIDELPYCIPVIEDPCYNGVGIEEVILGSIINNTNGVPCGNGYFNYSNSFSTSNPAGNTVNFSIKLRTSNVQRVNIYVDYNNDGDFDDANETVAIAYEASVYYPAIGSFIIPASQPVGNCRVRIISNAFFGSTFDACNTTRGEAEDYTLTVTPYVQPPYCTPVSLSSCDFFWIQNVTLGSITNNNTNCNGGYSDYSSMATTAFPGETVNFSFESYGNADQKANVYVDYNNDNDFDDAGEQVATDVINNYGTPGTGSFIIPTPLAGGDYRVRIISELESEASPTPCHTIYGEAEDYTLYVSPVYCTPVIDDPCSNSYITNVTIGNINNDTDCSSYDDYSATQSTTVQQGEVVNYSITSPYNIEQNASIYIDYNSDGDFDDAGEQVAANVYMYSYGIPATGSFQIPALQAPGNYRIRVVSDLSYHTTEPCHSYYGEIEDYTLTVQPITYTTLNLELTLEGLYTDNGQMRTAMDASSPHWGAGIADKITVELHDMYNYANIIWSESNVDLSTAGLASVMVPSNYNGSYYLTIKHRNSIETVSMNPVSFSTGPISYDFDLPAKAHGNNLQHMIDGRWVIYCGDVNHDGQIDTADMTPVDNDAANYTSGYLDTDTNGDGVIDTADMTIVDNNAASYISAATP